MTNSAELITDTYLYDAWGNLISSVGTTINPFQWTGGVGYYFDADTGNFYIRARTYQPTIGRWLNADPLGFVDGLNLYIAYFVPNGVDPTGTKDCVFGEGVFEYLDCVDACGVAHAGTTFTPGIAKALCVFKCKKKHCTDGKFEVFDISKILDSNDIVPTPGFKYELKKWESAKIYTPWGELKAFASVSVEFVKCKKESGGSGVMVKYSVKGGGKFCRGLKYDIDDDFKDKWLKKRSGSVTVPMPDCGEKLIGGKVELGISGKAGAGVTAKGEVKWELYPNPSAHPSFKVGICVGAWAGAEVCASLTGTVSGKYTI